MADSGLNLDLQGRRATRRFRLAWMIGIATACLVVVDAQAQQQLRQPARSVDVDWSVIDELDNAPAARFSAPGARTRPRATPTAAVTPAPRAETPASKTASTEKRGKTTAKRTETAAVQTAPAFTPPASPPVFSDTPPAPLSLRPPAGAAPPSAPAMLTPPPPPPPAAVARATPPDVPAAPVAPMTTPAPANSSAAIPLTPPPAPPPVSTLSPPAATAAIPAPAPTMAAPTMAAPTLAPPPAAMPAPAATAPVPPAPAAPAQVASLPPASQGVDGRVGAIDFTAGATDMPPTGKGTLDKTIAELKRDDAARLQIVAYATGGDEAGSQARRLSLSRALAVRSYLIDQGIRSTRMDVRALGNRSPDGPADRVDMVLVRR